MLPTAENDPLLEGKNIRKAFPGVVALDDVSFQVPQGKILALLGENGAGKSTLVKILSGAITRDSGTIRINGLHLPRYFSPLEARKSGIAIIYQELSLMSQLSVAENIYITHEPRRSRFPLFIDYGKMKAYATEQIAKLSADHFNVIEKVEKLSLPEKQMVEIAKALSTSCRVILMDEPTTSLTWEETERLFNVIRSLKDQGVTVLYISHRLDEVFQIASSAIVLRDGKLVGHVEIAQCSKSEMISLITGKVLIHRGKTVQPASVGKKERKVIFQAQHLTDNKMIKDASFCLYENEILGFGGLVGSRRTELARLIFGADKLKGGTIRVDGNGVIIPSPMVAIKNGIGYLSENRKEEGLSLGLSVAENIIQTNMKPVTRLFVLVWLKVRELCESFIGKLGIKGRPSTVVLNLSGGNQQKVALAKWLHANCRILILDEPTRGIDVRAKAEIYDLIKNFAQGDRAAIVISSEVDELVDLCERVIIMSKGEITHELKSQEISHDNILHLITTKEKLSS